MFYLGTHRPTWLAKAGVPLFVSRRVMPKRKLPVAIERWCLDSGGFTELSMNGSWSITTKQYANEVERYREHVGLMDWCAPMDWMCEPNIVEKTGLSVFAHQQRTVANFLDLRDALGDIVIPVLQGFTIAEYERCVDMYGRYGVNLWNEQTVGVGSICRRGQDREITAVIAELRGMGLRNLHGFGIRGLALHRNYVRLQSADSMAWSSAARSEAYHGETRLEGHEDHNTCENCLEYALHWRKNLLNKAGRFVPTTIDLEMTA